MGPLDIWPWPRKAWQTCETKTCTSAAVPSCPLNSVENILYPSFHFTDQVQPHTAQTPKFLIRTPSSYQRHGWRHCCFGWEMNVTEFGLFTSIWSSCSSDHLVELYMLTQENLGVTIVFGLPRKMWMAVVCDGSGGTLHPALLISSAMVASTSADRSCSISISSRIRLTERTSQPMMNTEQMQEANLCWPVRLWVACDHSRTSLFWWIR